MAHAPTCTHAHDILIDIEQWHAVRSVRSASLLSYHSITPATYGFKLWVGGALSPDLWRLTTPHPLRVFVVPLCSPSRCFTPVGGAEQSMLRSARVASARPPAPSCPRSARALGSRPFASSHAAHASGDRGARTAAAQQELHCERRTAPAHTKRTLTRPSATPPCASHGLVTPASAGPEAAASP